MLYLVVSETTLSAPHMRLDGAIKQLIYYLSKALQDAETRSPMIQKLVVALIVATKKLRPYF